MLDNQNAATIASQTNVELIEKTLGDFFATPAELALAERLQGAIEELDRLTQALQKMEALNGADSRVEG